MLGIDYGSKRIGVAVSDELGITAQGVATITRKNHRQVIEEIERIAHAYQIDRIVLGYPLRLDNTEGIQCQKVRAFARILSSTLSLPVILRDETLTTKEAEEILRSSYVRRKRKKEVVDRLAAGIILQGYLDSLSLAEKSSISHREVVYEGPAVVQKT